MLTPEMVRLAITGIPRPSKAAVHPAQASAWETCAVYVGYIKFDPQEFPEFGSKEVTIGGIPIELNIATDPSTVEFYDECARLVAKIDMLAIPVGFEQIN